MNESWEENEVLIREDTKCTITLKDREYIQPVRIEKL